MIEINERRKFETVPLCGERVVARLEASGVKRLSDLRGRDPWELMHEINLAAGRRLWHPPVAVVALQNLVDAAEREDTGPPVRRTDATRA